MSAPYARLGAVTQSRPLLLVDAASLYFRAYFGVPESAAKAPDGSPVNAVKGFLDMLATLVRGRQPGRVACALDLSWRPAWRVALIDSYKRHRLAKDGGEEVPANLVPQVPILLDVLAAFGIATVGAEDYEADDVIGTLATREPGPTEIATGDRDLLQLINDTTGVRVLYCGKGVAKLEVYDEAAVAARYLVPAGHYADFAALRGDPSDGLPGVGGIGEKTAAGLVARFGGLDAIMAALADPAAPFAAGVRAKLAAATDYLAAAGPVVRVATDVPVPRLDLTLPSSPADPDRLLSLAERWNLASPVRRLVDAAAGVTTPA